MQNQFPVNWTQQAAWNAESTGRYCGALLDSRDIHLRTCRMNSINHEQHEAQDLTKQAHIQTAPAPPISEVSVRNPTKQLAGDLMLVDVSFHQAGRDDKCGVIDFSIVTPAAESYSVPKQQRHRYMLQTSEKRQNCSNTFKPTSSWTTYTLSRLL